MSLVEVARCVTCREVISYVYSESELYTMDYRNQQSSTDPDDRLPTVAQPSLKLKVKKRTKILRPAIILPYRSHGTANYLQIKGRVIESPGHKSAIFTKRSKKLHNFFTIVRSLRSNAIPGALLEAEFRGQTYRFYTDSEGFFLMNLWVGDEPLDAGWHKVQLTLIDSIAGMGATAVACSYVPDTQAQFAVISDIDDTVLESSAFDKIQQIKLTLFKDAASRSAVEEVIPLYQRLIRGSSGDRLNPVFYLSRSGWNINQLLQDFLDINNLPKGPMFLRDLAWGEAKSLALGSHNHKIDYIRALLSNYPDLPFVLMGDSGQHDPETYWQIAMENPGRIKAIYLHDLERKSRSRAVSAICSDLKRRGIPVMHTARVVDYYRHMQDIGLIE